LYSPRHYIWLPDLISDFEPTSCIDSRFIQNSSGFVQLQSDSLDYDSFNPGIWTGNARL
jgi:hypothetical protein